MSKTRHGRRQLTAAQCLPHRIEQERRAALLDRLADAELQHGHHLAAENLAHRAAEIREHAR